MTIYAHHMPTAFQLKFRRSGIMAGPECFAARAPFHLAVGPSVATESEAARMADAFDAIFDACPMHQWGAAAQAAMGTKA